MRRANHKSHIPGPAAGAPGNHSSQFLTGNRFAFHTQRHKAGTFAHRRQNCFALLFQCLVNLGLIHIFIRQRRFGQFQNTKSTEPAQTLLIFRHPFSKIARIELSHTNQINILHSPPSLSCCMKTRVIPQNGTARGAFSQNSMYGLTSLRHIAWITASRPGWTPAESKTLYTVVIASSGLLFVWLRWQSANFLQPS